MNLIKTVIPIGLSAPLRILHLSDTHFCLADGQDTPRLHELAARRTGEFEAGDIGCIERYFSEALAYAHENNLPVVHTGDLIDFLSHAGRELMHRCRNEFFLFAAGNHEFCHYVGEAKEDLPYKMASLARIEPAAPHPMLFFSRVLGGINFVSVDNSYYLFTDWQLERLKAEVNKGLPIVLLMHTPLYTDALYEEMMARQKQPCAYVVGCPEEKMACYPPERYAQQLADRPTLRFIDYVAHESAIRAILAGHQHFAWEDRLPCGIPQYVTGGGFRGCAREIEFV